MSVSNELDLKIAVSELFEFTHRLVFTEIFYFKKSLFDYKIYLYIF